jgi:hypothetical protein
MPEEDVETAELKERIEEGVERALEEDGRPGARWTLYLSLSTAIIAVFAAVASLESGANSNDALLEKNEAVLAQAKASDQWEFYQAKGIKAFIAATMPRSRKRSPPRPKASKKSWLKAMSEQNAFWLAIIASRSRSPFFRSRSRSVP